MTVTSSANITGSDKMFILTGRLFTYIMKNKGPRSDPWGT